MKTENKKYYIKRDVIDKFIRTNKEKFYNKIDFCLKNRISSSDFYQYTKRTKPRPCNEYVVEKYCEITGLSQKKLFELK